MIYPPMFNMQDKPAEEVPRYNKYEDNVNLKQLEDDFITYIDSFRKKLSKGEDW